MTTLPSAYQDGLRMLARRDLSEADMRQRLARRGHDAAAIDDAVARLLSERALDDERVAEAIARHEAEVKGRGRHRVVHRIEQAGIAPSIARRAVELVFNRLGDAALLDRALDKRLRGGSRIADER
jgi:regulatory protein